MFVLFCDTRAELATPKQQQSWWTYFKFWTETAALCTVTLRWALLAGQWLTLPFRYTFQCVYEHTPSWLFRRRPPNGPDTEVLARRRRRYRRAMMQQLHQIRPSSRRTARALSAALALTQLAYQTRAQVAPNNLADFHQRVQVLRDIVAPPPPTTVQQEYVEAFSIMINTTEAELDHTDLTLCPAPFDSDSGIIGVDGRASGCISDKQVDVVPGTLQKTNKRVKVFGGLFTGEVYKCTLRWTFLDHAGAPHTFEIPNSYYIPGGG